MSASPVQSTAPSQKRPLEEPSSPTGPTDQPDAKRPALDKTKAEDTAGPATTADSTSQENASAKPESATAGADAPQNGTTDGQGDTVVPDAPPSGMIPASQVLETQPIQSTTANGSDSHPSYDQQDESKWLHVRAIISSAEAATVIGKGGENVSQIRRLSGAKCTVSEYTRGAAERILTVSGLVDAVAKVSSHSSHHGIVSVRSLLILNPGVRSHHPYAQPRASRLSLHSPIQDLPSSPPYPPCSYWVYHWQVRHQDQRDPGSLWRSPQCIRLCPSSINRAVPRCSGRC